MLIPPLRRAPGTSRHAAVVSGRLGLAAFVLLLLGVSNDASAAALGSLVTSVGLLATLAALLVFKGWSGHAPGTLWPAGGLLAMAAGGLLTWRALRLPLPSALNGFRVRWMTARRSHKPLSRWNSPSADRLAELEVPALTRDLCDHFIRLQRAWDSNDLGEMQLLTTAAMFVELRSQLGELAGSTQQTDVLTLDANLLAYEQCESVELVCVEFSGLLRESSDRGPAPFRELWMLERRKAASGVWKLARQQTLL